MTVVLNNNATGTLAQGISASAVQIQLNPGEGALFPVLGTGEYFYGTLVSASGTSEIVKATYRNGDLIGIVRAQEGTQTRSFPAGSLFELRVTVGNVTALIPEPQITVSSTPPTNPTLNQLWLEID